MLQPLILHQLLLLVQILQPLMILPVIILLRNYIRRIYREIIPLIYARTNYKLFIHSTFDALDENLMIKSLPGVFCAGEMLDWEAPTGGYLLSGCFASGRAAGQGALAWLNRNASP